MNTYEAQQPIPSHIGQYEIVSIIGRGGMGIVYLARDPRLERQVAIKCLRTELFENHYRERFKREALLLAKLNHPHIVQIYDFIESPEQLALVMEYVDGHNLQIHLREHLANFSQRLQWLTQITQGLAIAHDAGIIHRDLKTENILINKQGIAKISDLGIAKSQDFNVTITDHVAGSYCSMSPEQAMGETINFKSDLFSLGILAYQLLCGAHPFGDTSNKLQVMQRIISHPPIPPAQHNPDLPVEINNLLGQLLAKNPDNRPDNTHWVAAEFEKLRQLFPTSQVFDSDDTQALVANFPNPSGIRITDKLRYTQEHPTFDTRYLKAGQQPKKTVLQRLYHYLKAHLVSATMMALTVLILCAVAIWQLQPKPPKYIAVVPPTINTKDMPESQQELIKGAVYDAIQQSIIQLNDFSLIPYGEVIDAGNDIETIRRSTAADEIITTEIICKIESCSISVSRLTSDNTDSNGRLIVRGNRTVDILADNFLSMHGIVQLNLSHLYSANLSNPFKTIEHEEYTSFLQANIKYRTHGATHELAHALDRLNPALKKLPVWQTLYTEIMLDLYYQTRNSKLLTQLHNALENNEKTDITHYLYNLYYLQIAQENYDAAQQSIKKIEEQNSNASLSYELYAYLSMAKNDYSSAIDFYKKALNIRRTANNLYGMSNAYWHHGNIIQAKKYLAESLKLSPNHYKSHSMQGLIGLFEGDIQQALLSFEKTTAQNPNNVYELGNFGVAHLLAKNYTKAIDVFDKALALEPENTSLMLNKADAFNLAGNKDQASTLYRKITLTIEKLKKPTNEQLRNLSQAYAHLRSIQEALATLQALEKLDPQNIETTYTAALIHTIAENNASAIFNITQALDNGINRLWFSFSWFDKLCANNNFIAIMKKHGEHNRCLPYVIP